MGSSSTVLLLEAGVEQRRDGNVGCMLFEFGTITLLDELSSKVLTKHQFLRILLQIARAL